jgi:hypothetical protein
VNIPPAKALPGSLRNRRQIGIAQIATKIPEALDKKVSFDVWLVIGLLNEERHTLVQTPTSDIPLVLDLLVVHSAQLITT